MPETPTHILVVDDEEILREVLLVLLSEEGYQVQTASDGQEAIELVQTKSFDVVLTDLHMDRVDGLETLRRVRQLDPSILVILMTAYSSVESAVTALREGAYDYISKPLNDNEIRVTVRNALEQRRLWQENQQLRRILRARYDFENLIGKSEPMQAIFSLIRKVSRSHANVLISGPSGTGKELVAHAIHFNSSRASQPFIPVNCSAIPDSLFESEMFGHVKGAFTGAIGTHQGLFEQAHTGTLFLDELGELSAFNQAKLLRAIQQGQIKPVGSSQTLAVDVRILAATNKELEKEVAQGNFREDLFYRINVVNLRLPRLAERREDIGTLAYFFLNRAREQSQGQATRFSREAMALLNQYQWPGNVRQLENVVERAVILAEGDTIEVDDLPAFLQEQTPTPATFLGDEPIQLDDYLRDYETQLISQALQKCGHNISQAARMLGIHRRTLSSRIQRYDLARDLPDQETSTEAG